jgi:hypothetical protein
MPPASQKYKYTTQRSKSYRRSNTFEYGHDTNWTQSPEETSGVHNHGQAKPEE